MVVEEFCLSFGAALKILCPLVDKAAQKRPRSDNLPALSPPDGPIDSASIPKLQRVTGKSSVSHRADREETLPKHFNSRFSWRGDAEAFTSEIMAVRECCRGLVAFLLPGL